MKTIATLCASLGAAAAGGVALVVVSGVVRLTLGYPLVQIHTTDAASSSLSVEESQLSKPAVPSGDEEASVKMPLTL